MMKVRYCGFSTDLNYKSKNDAVFDLRAKSKGYSQFNCKVTCEKISSNQISKNCQCGGSAMARIINGEDVPNPGYFPWQAILKVDNRLGAEYNQRGQKFE